jgi:energy-coupling factor transport system permease protein
MVLSIGSIFVWFFQSTENKELVYVCEKKGMNPKAGYVLLSTLQMISVLQHNSKIIMSAQEARGVETKGNLIVRMKAFIPSLIPLILGAINNAEERVLTLESKGFTARCEKTRLFTVEPNGKERIALIIAAAAVALVLAWRIVLWLR